MSMTDSGISPFLFSEDTGVVALGPVHPALERKVKPYLVDCIALLGPC
jgi:hypothetical protein